MAKVIKAFRERYHDMKRYSVGDDYPDDDKKRVTYLVKTGYLVEPEKPKPAEKPKRGKKGADADDSDA
ncbi:hypothetical protein [Paenibacillus ginsengihumi]|uniref:hypothetical protein n=1 Tax=Paenibacillus ginsengihumi TaxID=431596 RepID=UPI00039A7CBC|nr:hypothetical protein [Paenibacillus ginsengihumi]